MEALSKDRIVYPDSDGRPLADNTAQYRWIVFLKENLEVLLPSDFVAADLLWYPTEGEPQTRFAPDVMVALGRPKGERGSYQQWLEGGVAPQFVVEVLSPGNDKDEMVEKHAFYESHGVEEYLVIDPDKDEPERAILEVFVRSRGMLQLARFKGTWKSKRLGITFAREGERLVVRRPDGEPFLSFVQVMSQRDAAQAERDAAQAERDAAQAERDAAQAERDAAQAERNTIAAELDATQTERHALASKLDVAHTERDDAREHARRLAERLRALGLDPDDV